MNRSFFHAKKCPVGAPSFLSFAACVRHTPARYAAALLLSATLSASAFAGGLLGGTGVLSINVADGTNSWNPVTLNTQFLTVDAAGNIQMAETPAQLGSNWAWGTVSVVDKTGNYAAQKALTWSNGMSTFSIYATGNVDPFMNYALIGSNHTGVTQTYTLHYGESVVPPINPGNYGLFSDIGMSLSGTNSTIAPAVGSSIQKLSLSNDGVSYYNAGVDVGGTHSNTGTTTTGVFYDPISGGGSSLSAISAWAFDVAFTVTAHASAGVSGYAEITQLSEIPEPSSYAALMGGGVLLGVAWFRRRLAVA
jgi:hypothetical protein